VEIMSTKNVSEELSESMKYILAIFIYINYNIKKNLFLMFQSCQIIQNKQNLRIFWSNILVKIIFPKV
jgi:hypothetical protein